MAKEEMSIKQGVNGYYFVSNGDGILATFKHIQHAAFFVKKYQEIFSNLEDHLCYDCMEEPIYADRLCQKCYFK